jgi:hypothetical protein
LTFSILDATVDPVVTMSIFSALPGHLHVFPPSMRLATCAWMMIGAALAAVTLMLPPGALSSAELSTACVYPETIAAAELYSVCDHGLVFSLQYSGGHDGEVHFFSLDFATGTFSIPEQEPVTRKTKGTDTPWTPEINSDTVCIRKGTSSIVVRLAKPMPSPTADAEYGMSVRYAVSENGDLLALGAPEGGDASVIRIYVYETATSTLLHSFRERHLSGGIEFIGRTLLLDFCAAGPGCETRMMDVMRKRYVGSVGSGGIILNTYGSFHYRVSGDLWVFISPQDGRALWIDTSNGTVKKDLSFIDRGTDAEVHSAAGRVDNGTVALVLASPYAGHVVLFNLNGMSVKKHFEMPACPPARQ